VGEAKNVLLIGAPEILFRTSVNYGRKKFIVTLGPDMIKMILKLSRCAFLPFTNSAFKIPFPGLLALVLRFGKRYLTPLYDKNSDRR